MSPRARERQDQKAVIRDAKSPTAAANLLDRVAPRWRRARTHRREAWWEWRAQCLPWSLLPPVDLTGKRSDRPVRTYASGRKWCTLPSGGL
ncbi:hypothetical protein NDU88_002992 [Pleurodeles waltl]|uniref:Uncharacterized protein n=1 Tax=Pleurodeles waltl TaxID=8319 RepID=A0AAV7UYR1_PLEWA|nr:hypothetical protein NDU88_002992 [Pleurodeles waltl]